MQSEKIEQFRIISKIIGKSYYIETLKRLELDGLSLKYIAEYEIIAEDFKSRNDAEIWLYNNRRDHKVKGFTIS